MPVIRQAQTNFTLGEFSPKMVARSDISPYKNGAAKLTNRIPLSQGGTGTRPGTRIFATNVPYPSRMIPFRFSASQLYICMLSAGQFDAWLVLDQTQRATVTGCPWTEDMVPNLGWAQSGDTLLVFHETMIPQRLKRTGVITFTLDAMPIDSPAQARYVPSTVQMAFQTDISGEEATGSDTNINTDQTYFAEGAGS